jgi:Sugar (and other) transporter
MSRGGATDFPQIPQIWSQAMEEMGASARRARRNVILAEIGPRLGRSGAFWFYGAIGLLTLAFCWKLVPETKGKRLEEIEAFFQARVKP